MKININGVTRDMTAEEEAKLLASAPEPQAEEITPDQRMDEIEAAIMELAAMIEGA